MSQALVMGEEGLLSFAWCWSRCGFYAIDSIACASAFAFASAFSKEDTLVAWTSIASQHGKSREMNNVRREGWFPHCDLVWPALSPSSWMWHGMALKQRRTDTSHASSVELQIVYEHILVIDPLFLICFLGLFGCLLSCLFIYSIGWLLDRRRVVRMWYHPT